MASFVHLLDQRRLIAAGGSTVAGDIYFYYTGTSVLAPVYQDSGLTIPSENPISVAAGEAIPTIYLDTDIIYRRVIQYADGTSDETDPIGEIFSEGDLGLPVGSILDYSGPTAPEGFLFCYGQAVSRATYPELFAAIGTTYGSGNGTTTFNLPDYRGRVAAGKDNMGGFAAGRLVDSVTGTTLGATGGEEGHVLSEDELPSHSHGITDPGHTHSYTKITPTGGITTGTPAFNNTTGNTGSSTTGITINDTGGDTAHNNVQPTIILNKIIKVTPVTFLSLIGLAPDFTNKANAAAIGIDPSATDMGTAPGTILSNNGTAKEWFEELERGVEGLVDYADDIVASMAAGTGAGLTGYLYNSTYLNNTVGKKLQQYVSVKDFGAKGDGVTDDTAAIAVALAYAVNSNVALYWPGGVYINTFRHTLTMPNPGTGLQDTNAFAQLKMFGDGMSNTEIRNTATGFLKIIGTGQQNSVNFQDFAITTGQANGGVGLELNCTTYPFFGEWTAKSVIKVHFRGSDGINNVFYWTKAVEVIDWSNIDFSHSMFDGASTPAGLGVVTSATAHSMPFVCVFDFIGTHFRFLNVGYEYGTGTQSANLDSCFFGMNVTDVYATAGGSNHQGLSITNSECYKFAAGNGVVISCDVPNFVFTGNRWAVHAGHVGLLLDVTNQTNITNNQFFPDTTPNTAISAIDIAGTVSGSHCIIDGNNFASTTIGVRLKNTSSNVLFGVNNKCTSTMTLVTNAGTNNDIGVIVKTSVGRIGYGTGAGATVTQLTNKSTAVTINAPAGQIITSNSSLGAGVWNSFTVNNNSFNSTDTVILMAANGNYMVRASDPANGSFKIRIKNEEGGGPLSDAVVINFVIIKGSAT